jgi:hypothetical protein
MHYAFFVSVALYMHMLLDTVSRPATRPECYGQDGWQHKRGNEDG